MLHKKLIVFSLMLGLFTIAKPSYHLLKRGYFQFKAEKEWASWKNKAQASHRGDPVAWLKWEQGPLNSMVLWGANASNLALFPSMLEDKQPEEEGLKVVLGHRDQEFKKLEKIKIGNTLELQAVFKSKRYRVDDIDILSPDQTEARLEEQKKENRLALVTCYPFQYTGPAPLRYVVWASPI